MKPLYKNKLRITITNIQFQKTIFVTVHMVKNLCKIRKHNLTKVIDSILWRINQAMFITLVFRYPSRFNLLSFCYVGLIYIVNQML